MYLHISYALYTIHMDTYGCRLSNMYCIYMSCTYMYIYIHIYHYLKQRKCNNPEVDEISWSGVVHVETMFHMWKMVPIFFYLLQGDLTCVQI